MADPSDTEPSRRKEWNEQVMIEMGRRRNSKDMSSVLMPEYADWLEWASDVGSRRMQKKVTSFPLSWAPTHIWVNDV